MLPKPGVLVQGGVQLGGIFLLLFFQSFQALLHSGNVFGKLIGGIVLGICQRRQKQILFRTQFLQILCQSRNLSRQLPVPKYMNRRECLFFGKQAAALFRLIPDVLCQLIVLCEGRAQRIQRSIQAFLALAKIPQLIAEQQQIFTQILHGLGKRRDGVLDCHRQLFNLSSQLPEHGIVRLNLSV